MKLDKNLPAEFKKELKSAIKLSVFLTALVFGFLIFQNRTATTEEIADQNPSISREQSRMPASEGK